MYEVMEYTIMSDVYDEYIDMHPAIEAFGKKKKGKNREGIIKRIFQRIAEIFKAIWDKVLRIIGVRKKSKINFTPKQKRNIAKGVMIMGTISAIIGPILANCINLDKIRVLTERNEVLSHRIAEKDQEIKEQDKQISGLRDEYRKYNKEKRDKIGELTTSLTEAKDRIKQLENEAKDLRRQLADESKDKREWHYTANEINDKLNNTKEELFESQYINGTLVDAETEVFVKSQKELEKLSRFGQKTAEIMSRKGFNDASVQKFSTKLNEIVSNIYSIIGIFDPSKPREVES